MITAQGFQALPIGIKHGQIAGSLPGPHRDPFDRMLIAQAILESLTPDFGGSGVRQLRGDPVVVSR